MPPTVKRRGSEGPELAAPSSAMGSTMMVSSEREHDLRHGGPGENNALSITRDASGGYAITESGPQPCVWRGLYPAPGNSGNARAPASAAPSRSVMDTA